MREREDVRELHNKIDHLTQLVEQLSTQLSAIQQEKEVNQQREQEFQAGDRIRISTHIRDNKEGRQQSHRFLGIKYTSPWTTNPPTTGPPT